MKRSERQHLRIVQRTAWANPSDKPSKHRLGDITTEHKVHRTCKIHTLRGFLRSKRCLECLPFGHIRLLNRRINFRCDSRIVNIPFGLSLIEWYRRVSQSYSTRYTTVMFEHHIVFCSAAPCLALLPAPIISGSPSCSFRPEQVRCCCLRDHTVSLLLTTQTIIYYVTGEWMLSYHVQVYPS